MSEQEAMVLRSTKILCRTASGLGDSTVDGLPIVMHLASVDLNVFRVTMRRVRDFHHLALREREQMIFVNCIGKKNLKKSVGGR